MQLLVIAKGKRVNYDENQMIEVVNVTETIFCGLCRLTTEYDGCNHFRDGHIRCFKLKREPSGVINGQAPSFLGILDTGLIALSLGYRTLLCPSA